MHTLPSPGRGFTLIELVLAMGLCAFGILGLSGFLVLLERTEAEQTLACKALLCAQQKMETLRYQSLEEGLHCVEGKETLHQLPYRGMTRHWVVRPTPMHPRMLGVRVECSGSYKGKRVSKTLQTLMLSDG